MKKRVNSKQQTNKQINKEFCGEHRGHFRHHHGLSRVVLASSIPRQNISFQQLIALLNIFCDPSELHNFERWSLIIVINIIKSAQKIAITFLPLHGAEVLFYIFEAFISIVTNQYFSNLYNGNKSGLLPF